MLRAVRFTLWMWKLDSQQNDAKTDRGYGNVML